MVILKVGWKKRSADVLFAASEPERGRRGRNVTTFDVTV